MFSVASDTSDERILGPVSIGLDLAGRSVQVDDTYIIATRQPRWDRYRLAVEAAAPTTFVACSPVPVGPATGSAFAVVPRRANANRALQGLWRRRRRWARDVNHQNR
jgi:hypothetical protein